MSEIGFRHEAFLYADPDEFLSGTVQFVRDGLEAEEPTLVAMTRTRLDALRGELGSDGENVHFTDIEDLGVNPARIIPFWQRFLEEMGGAERPIRGIGEPVWPRRNAAQLDECQRHESLLNFAFGEGPAWRLLCLYDASTLADDALECAHRSHAVVSGSGSDPRRPQGRRVDPRSIDPFAGSLPDPATEATVFSFDRDFLHEARRVVSMEAEGAGLSPERRFDLTAAVGELTANSVRHGGGKGVLSVWHESGAVAVEVKDAGLIDEPLTGRRRPTLSQDGGRGLWMVNQLCDLVQVRSGAQGTVIRVWMEIR